MGEDDPAHPYATIMHSHVTQYCSYDARTYISSQGSSKSMEGVGIACMGEDLKQDGMGVNGSIQDGDSCGKRSITVMILFK